MPPSLSLSVKEIALVTIFTSGFRLAMQTHGKVPEVTPRFCARSSEDVFCSVFCRSILKEPLLIGSEICDAFLRQSVSAISK